MSQLKTKPDDLDVNSFLENLELEKQKADSFRILKMMASITGEEPCMWAHGIVGFGSYHYKYESGREGDWFLTGFSPRKQNLSLYIIPGFTEYSSLLSKLGKYKTGKSCLYINKLEDVDNTVLEKLIKSSVQHMKEQK